MDGTEHSAAVDHPATEGVARSNLPPPGISLYPTRATVSNTTDVHISAVLSSPESETCTSDPESPDNAPRPPKVEPYQPTEAREVGAQDEAAGPPKIGVYSPHPDSAEPEEFVEDSAEFSRFVEKCNKRASLGSGSFEVIDPLEAEEFNRPMSRETLPAGFTLRPRSGSTASTQSTPSGKTTPPARPRSESVSNVRSASPRLERRGSRSGSSMMAAVIRAKQAAANKVRADPLSPCLFWDLTLGVLAHLYYF